jgi:hypothetical protein
MAVVVALNVAVVAAAATVTEAGTVKAGLLLDSVTSAPPTGAAPDRVTVQVELLELFKLPGTHAMELTVGKTAAPVTIPPVAETAIPVPPGADAMLLLTAIAALVTPVAMVTLTRATVPFEMVLALMPEITHKYVLPLAAQFRDLPAAVVTGPGRAEIDTKLPSG